MAPALFTHLLLFIILNLADASECGWIILDNMLMSLEHCTQSRSSNGIMKSRKLACNANKDKILLHEWQRSNECKNKSDAISYPLSTHSFNCNECISSSYATYQTYETEECESQRIIIGDQVISDGPLIENSPYRQTTIVTNQCYNDTLTPYHQMITCNANSYSVHSYLDSTCDQLLSTNIVNSTNCREIIECTHPNDIDSPTTTNAYFTTTQSLNLCNFVNLDGYNIPTDKCIETMNFDRAEGHKYICTADDTINFQIYADGTPNCAGKLSFEYTMPLDSILAHNCEYETCSNAQYMEVKKYIYQSDEFVNCERSLAAVSDIDYSTELHVVDMCMNDGNGTWVKYECANNKNDADNAGYAITKYSDEHCTIPLDTLHFSDSECSQSKRLRTDMVWCNGPNNISSPKVTEILIDCNYFINDHNDPFHVIGEPLNECTSIRHGRATYSKKYKCNVDHSEIEEIVYYGEGCNDDNFWQTVQRPEIKIFHCESDYHCNAINYTNTENVTIYNYDSVMIGKQHTNDTCDDSDESIADFWRYQQIIIDVCWPIEDDNLYTMMSCDENGFVYYSLFYDAQCMQKVVVGDNVFDSDDCMFGKLFETVYCPHWIEADNASTSTAKPLNVSTTEIDIVTTEHMETTVFIKTTSFNGTEEEKRDGPEPCKNIFGGGDVGGISCKAWADIIWALIVLVVGIFVCFGFWCWCSYDTRSIRKQVSLSKSRSRSKLSISNGNKNEDIEKILVGQESKRRRRSNKIYQRPPPIQDNINAADDDDTELDL